MAGMPSQRAARVGLEIAQCFCPPRLLLNGKDRVKVVRHHGRCRQTPPTSRYRFEKLLANDLCLLPSKQNRSSLQPLSVARFQAGAWLKNECPRGRGPATRLRRSNIRARPGHHRSASVAGQPSPKGRARQKPMNHGELLISGLTTEPLDVNIRTLIFIVNQKPSGVSPRPRHSVLSRGLKPDG